MAENQASFEAHKVWREASENLPLADLKLPTSKLELFDKQICFTEEDGKTPIVNKRYRITAADGTAWEGASDSKGSHRSGNASL